MPVRFQIEYRTRFGENLFVNFLESNSLDVAFRLPMTTADGVVWTLTITEPFALSDSPLRYFYSVEENGKETRREWLQQPHEAELADGTIIDWWRDCPAEPWRQAGVFRHAWKEYATLDSPKFTGTSVPLFSLRTSGSFGVGDFGDLRELIDWAKADGQHIIQLLPINDTTLTHTWNDSYPYSPISVFALHPMYIDLRQLPKLSNTPKRGAYERQRRRLNSLEQVDYPKVNATKIKYLYEIFLQLKSSFDKANDDYLSFIVDNDEWLRPYVEFCYRRDGGRYDADFYYFLQYVADNQMRAAHDYAMQQGIALKGDLPIGVSPYGVDVEQYPALFNTDYETGAPPDEFSPIGQNWHFPTYNWQSMRADDYRWWRRRLRHLARYFDAYRIDHILGFFRIWEIPRSSGRAIDGQFSPALPLAMDEADEGLFVGDHRQPRAYHPRWDGCQSETFKRLSSDRQRYYRELSNDFFHRRSLNLWRDEARCHLAALVESTDMLVCGEDLGVVPECTKEVMDELGILSLEVETMPKAMGSSFADVANYPYLSVATFSTHDMPTLRQWWRDNRPLVKTYYNNVLGCVGEPPTDISADLARAVIDRQLESPSMLTILSLQDRLAAYPDLRRADVDSERINNPANPSNHWAYRMHLDISELPVGGKR